MTSLLKIPQGEQGGHDAQVFQDPEGRHDRQDDTPGPRSMRFAHGVVDREHDPLAWLARVPLLTGQRFGPAAQNFMLEFNLLSFSRLIDFDSAQLPH